MSLKIEPSGSEEQLNSGQSGISLETLYRHLLRIVAHLEESEYTEGNLDDKLRRAEVYHHSDPANPASDVTTSQG